MCEATRVPRRLEHTDRAFRRCSTGTAACSRSTRTARSKKCARSTSRTCTCCWRVSSRSRSSASRPALPTLCPSRHPAARAFRLPNQLQASPPLYRLCVEPLSSALWRAAQSFERVVVSLVSFFTSTVDWFARRYACEAAARVERWRRGPHCRRCSHPAAALTSRRAGDSSGSRAVGVAFESEARSLAGEAEESEAEARSGHRRERGRAGACARNRVIERRGASLLFVERCNEHVLLALCSLLISLFYSVRPLRI